MLPAALAPGDGGGRRPGSRRRTGPPHRPRRPLATRAAAPPAATSAAAAVDAAAPPVAMESTRPIAAAPHVGGRPAATPPAVARRGAATVRRGRGRHRARSDAAGPPPGRPLVSAPRLRAGTGSHTRAPRQRGHGGRRRGSGCCCGGGGDGGGSGAARGPKVVVDGRSCGRPLQRRRSQERRRPPRLTTLSARVKGRDSHRCPHASMKRSK